MNNSSDRGDEIIHVILSNIVRQDQILESQLGKHCLSRCGCGWWVETVMIITIVICPHGLTGNTGLYDQLHNHCRRLMDFLMTKCWSSGKSSLFLTGQSVARPHGTALQSTLLPGMEGGASLPLSSARS